MKIRSNYVSNSSSSSFVVFGYRIGNIYKKNLILDFDNKKYIMVGYDLYNGEDIINLNKTNFNWFRKQINESDIDCGDGTIIEVPSHFSVHCSHRSMPSCLTARWMPSTPSSARQISPRPRRHGSSRSSASCSSARKSSLR